MKRICIALASFALAFSFAACDAETNTGSDPVAPSDPGGIGMTYNGKLGYDYGGGFVQPFDGSAPGLGFGL